MTIATLAQLKTQLNIKQSDTTYDTKLTLFLSAGQAFIENFCDRKFESASYTELIHGNKTNTIIPKQWPIQSVTTLKISGTRAWADPASLIPSADYGISNDSTTVTYYAGLIPKGYDVVQLVYTAGYTTMPNDLVLANLWASEWFYLHNQRGDSGRNSTGKQGESIGILDDIPPMIRSILYFYRRLQFQLQGLAVDHA